MLKNPQGYKDMKKILNKQSNTRLYIPEICACKTCMYTFYIYMYLYTEKT